MIHSLLKIPNRLLFTNKKSIPFPIVIHLRFLHKRSTSENTQGESESKPSSLIVSYLVSSLGLSLQSALATAKKSNIKTTENCGSVINSFKAYGFSDTQIANVITKCPVFLSSNWDNTIMPKLDYLRAVGYSDTEITSLVSSVPHVITASLENRLKPNFEVLWSIIGSNQRIASAIRQTSRLIQGNLEARVLPNIRTLQACGVPDASIATLISRHPRVVTMSNEQFKVTVELVKEMGFNPLSTMFIHGVASMSRSSPSNWDKKVAFFKSMGWSEREVYSAFAKHPFIMTLSDQKVRKVMDFAVSQQWTPSFLSAHPVILSLSLEKRVMPRCSVLKVLESKGLEMRSSGVTFLLISEKNFVTKYVMKYMEKVHAVLEAYKSKLEAVALEGVQCL